eukprot:CAMPEP_0185842270 /NCGR_PEP_ID=MMETSP1353-20130828/18318_1 /TAXON_ID=1077150 /ORGANISM="Erythrolobus australicus, Strain CCMP3124" /LENGTH=115 /DNA_ID=CAMNT_0028541767 /DNA_START=137 /DNA_END=484 /DNA_ORIENTATION=+
MVVAEASSIGEHMANAVTCSDICRMIAVVVGNEMKLANADYEMRTWKASLCCDLLNEINSDESIYEPSKLDCAASLFTPSIDALFPIETRKQVLQYDAIGLHELFTYASAASLVK